eukprot:3666957-Prymnesium_polylepis.1
MPGLSAQLMSGLSAQVMSGLSAQIMSCLSAPIMSGLSAPIMAGLSAQLMSGLSAQVMPGLGRRRCSLGGDQQQRLVVVLLGRLERLLGDALPLRLDLPAQRSDHRNHSATGQGCG